MCQSADDPWKFMIDVTLNSLVTWINQIYTTGFFLISSVQSLYNVDFCFQIFVFLILAAILGGIYWQLEDDCKSGIQNRSVAIKDVSCIMSVYLSPPKQHLSLTLHYSRTVFKKKLLKLLIKLLNFCFQSGCFFLHCDEPSF